MYYHYALNKYMWSSSAAFQMPIIPKFGSLCTLSTYGYLLSQREDIMEEISLLSNGPSIRVTSPDLDRMRRYVSWSYTLRRTPFSFGRIRITPRWHISWSENFLQIPHERTRFTAIAFLDPPKQQPWPSDFKGYERAEKHILMPRRYDKAEMIANDKA